MKGVFVILDGVADLPCPELQNKTPLEAAKTPALDALARKSRIDSCITYKESVAPESSTAILSLFGYDPTFYPRGPLEALGAGIKLQKGDLALRTDFGTINDLGHAEILDRRAGRTLTTEEAQALTKTLNARIKLPYRVEFHPTIQHRGVLIVRGGFSDNISNADPAYGGGVTHTATDGTVLKMKYAHSLDDEEDSQLAANTINTIIRHSYEILDTHPINVARAKKGLFKANILICRDAGNEPTELKKLPGKWIALGYMPLEIGFARAAHMELYKFKYPPLKNADSYENLYAGLKAAAKNAKDLLMKYKNKYEYFYIHFKETDIPGHDNRPKDKVAMIEYLDTHFFAYLKTIIGQSKLIITADHTTACTKKEHTADPVPLLVYPHTAETAHRFTESNAAHGRKILGRKLLLQTFFKK